MKLHTEIFQVTSQNHGERLDKFLTASLGGRYSRQKVQEYIRQGQVLVNGLVQTTPKFSVEAGNEIEAAVPDIVTRLEPEEVLFDVLYHDANIAIINKPAGLVVHPEIDGGLVRQTGPTLAHGLMKRFPELHEEDSLRPGIVHRLDKDTSGLLVVGLSSEGQTQLGTLFASRNIHKEYLALVHGVPASGEGQINLPIGRHPYKKTCMAVVEGGREALSTYRVLHADADGAFSLLAVVILTGRTHQIRVHLSAIGHPIIGDRVYTGGNRPDSKLPTPLSRLLKPSSPQVTHKNIQAPRQMLHAWKLGFPFHSKEIQVQTPAVRVCNGHIMAECPPPDDFSSVLRTLLHKPLRIVVTGMPGSGKSSFTQALGALEVPTFSADECVRMLYGPDGDGTRLLRMRYGDAYVDASGTNKQALGAAMRSSDIFRREIEDMIHPLVFHALNEFWLASAAQPLAVAEIPLYFESQDSSEGGGEGRDNRKFLPLISVDCVIGVACPFSVRAARLQANRGWDDNVIRSMEAWQLSEDEKMERSDIVVANTDDINALQAKARTIHSQLLERYAAGVQKRAAQIEALWSPACRAEKN